MVSAVPDPRASNARHRLTDVMAVALLAVLSGADDYPGIVEFGLDRAELLRGLLALPHGVPSVSTFRRVFAAVDPAAMGEVLGRWSPGLVQACRGKQIAVDGKALRRSVEHAWARDGHAPPGHGLVRRGRRVPGPVGRGREVERDRGRAQRSGPARPGGAIVTVDAPNTQRAIAARIVEAGGDYVMALKDNHPPLFDRVVRNVDDLILERFRRVGHTATDDADAGHGRPDRRRVYTTDPIEWLTGEQRASFAGAACRRRAAAGFFKPDWRSSVTAAFRRADRATGAAPVRARQASSPIVTSRTWNDGSTD